MTGILLFLMYTVKVIIFIIYLCVHCEVKKRKLVKNTNLWQMALNFNIFIVYSLDYFLIIIIFAYNGNRDDSAVSVIKIHQKKQEQTYVLENNGYQTSFRLII